MTKKTLKERIESAFRPGEKSVQYYELAARVYPHSEYPRAWEYQRHGGSPALVLSLTPALKRAGCEMYASGGVRYVCRPRALSTEGR